MSEACNDIVLGVESCFIHSTDVIMCESCVVPGCSRNDVIPLLRWLLKNYEKEVEKRTCITIITNLIFIKF